MITDRLRSAIQIAEDAFPHAAQVPVVVNTGDARWLLALAEGTNQPTITVRADLLDGTNLIRHWLVGRTVDSVGLAAELRQWADTFDPQSQPIDLPDGASPWLGDEADAVALCSHAATLDPDEWMWSRSGNAWLLMGDLPSTLVGSVLLRRKPQTVTVELPKDVAGRIADAHDGSPLGGTIVAACREALGR